MNLALFDLDHTLLPFDSGLAWTHFLVDRGVLPSGAVDAYVQHGRDYLAGRLDIHALHREVLAPLAAADAATLAAWSRDFEAALAPRVPPERRAWVEAHRAAGDLCAIVTATTRFIAAAPARLFGIDHLLASEAGQRDGRFTGELAGDPCYREFKIAHVERWLAGRGQRMADMARVYFYSDSINDLPLLRAASHPVVVRPDPRLRALATEAGWPVIDPT